MHLFVQGRGRCQAGRPESAGVGVTENLVALDQDVIECEPGGSTGRATGEAEEVLFVIAGSGALRLGEESYALEPETGAYLAPGQQYELHNEGSGPLRIVCVRIRAPAGESDGSPSPSPSPSPPGPASSSPRVVVRRLAEQEAQQATTERSFRIVADPTTGLRSATQFVGYIPPRRAPDHFHTYDEVIYVLEGTGTFRAGGTVRPIGAGSTIVLPARTVHCLENTGEEEMRLVAVFRPAGSPAHAYYPDGTPAYPGTPPLMRKVGGA
jgi:mannose-6-phosphate isomerase-like protein (cupin superfamily)